MMENTLENKAKFYYNHLGGNVRYCHRGGVFEYATLTHTTNENSNLMSLDWFEEYYPEDYYLEVKPLSLISDEDAINVARILGIDNDAMAHHGRLFTTRLMGSRYGNSQDNCYLTYTSLWACDYLRSRGYAVPFMGESIETLLEYGWIKLKED